VRTVAEAGPNQLAARVIDGQTVLAWMPHPADTHHVERVILDSDRAAGRAGYSVIRAGEGGGLVLNDGDLFWVTEGPYARMTVRDNTLNDGDGNYGPYTDDGNNAGFCAGRGWASASSGADVVFVATRNGLDGGVILSSDGRFDPPFLAVIEVLHQVDPDDPAKYARGLFVEGAVLDYTTGGAGFATSPGVYRVSAAGGAPQRLADARGEPGQIVVDATSVWWAEPGRDRIVLVPHP